MPTGTWWGSSPRDSSSNPTGAGQGSQPKSNSSWADAPLTIGAGYRPGMATPYPIPSGARPGNTYQPGQRGYGQFSSPQGPSAYMPGPIAQYPDAVYSPYSPMNAAQSIVTSLYGPQQELLAQERERMWSQAMHPVYGIGAQADRSADVLHRDNALARQSLGLDRQALGLDRNLTNTQLANLDRLRGILRQQYGLAGDVLANQMTGFQIDEDKARDMAKRETFDLRSALTARGAFNTVANERGTGRIDRDLQYNLRGIDVGRQGARLTHRGTIFGLDEKGIGYDNQQASLNSRLANLGLDEKRLGISSQQLANSLEDGLFQIGLGANTSVNELLGALSSNNAQHAQMSATILGEVMNYANLPPEALAAWRQAIAKAMGGGGGGYATGQAGQAQRMMRGQ